MFVLSIILGAANDPDPWINLLVKAISGAFAGAFLVSLLGLIWAICTPTWIERYIEKVMAHVSIWLLILMIVLGALYFASLRLGV
jgi:hypothetical protein